MQGWIRQHPSLVGKHHWRGLAALSLSLGLFSAPSQAQNQIQNHLANTTVVIIRHAEKSPASGRSLTPQGLARARDYAHYFDPLHAEGETIRFTALYAGADSKGSMRPRLTLEPLSHTLHLPLNTQFSTGEPQQLVAALESSAHGDHILIAWRHGKIPALLQDLGADPEQLLPGGKWPDAVFDWMVLLHYDSAGHLQSQKLLHEPQPLP